MNSRNSFNTSGPVLPNTNATSGQYVSALIKDMRGLTEKLDSFYLSFRLGWERRWRGVERQDSTEAPSPPAATS
jgi:hypothetical protein